MAGDDTNASRIVSVDILRGLVMVVMALDHVRDYWSLTGFDPLDLTQTTPQLFFTRWITHFCAPVFVFLSGASAWLYRSHKNASRSELARFLLTRGLWLVLIEITLVSWSWQFIYQVVILQVIWAIGWSMIALAALVYLPLPAILAVGLAMIFGHNLLDPIAPERFGSLSWLWIALHVSKFVPLTIGWPTGVADVYPLVPWIGVMATGYAFGALLELPRARRDRLLVTIGLGAAVAFVAIRALNVYGDPQPWSVQERGALYTVLSFVNTTKYPPSLQYLLMTLGPAIALIPALERWRGGVARVFETFGRVPFFYYVIHVPLVHASARAWYWIAFDAPRAALFDRAQWPAGYEPSLLRAYAVWAVTVFLLYWPSRWFMELRRRRRDWWLSYL
jgi:uncharacterized membrane protein